MKFVDDDDDADDDDSERDRTWVHVDEWQYIENTRMDFEAVDTIRVD